MAESEMRKWAEKDFAYRYLREADVRIVDRRRMLEILKSFYSHFLGDVRGGSVLDLGCGDGIVTYELLQIDDSISATLIDGSEDMLNRARERLAGYKDIRFIRTTLQELPANNTPFGDMDFVFSSLAIHHLTAGEKKALFEYIYAILVEGGCFVNIDLILSPSKPVEKWYLELWRGWMVEKAAELNFEDKHEWVIGSCMEKGHYSTLDTLADQLKALEEAGFTDVDCFYKHGMYAMYGGRKKQVRCDT